MKLLHRKNIRLRGYDYSRQGYYYVTICTKNKEFLFGEIVNKKMILNRYGNIVNDVWVLLPKHYNVKLDVIQIMPNHVHMIIVINNNVGAGYSRPKLSEIIAYFKYQSTKQINNYLNGSGNPTLKGLKGREDPAPTGKQYRKIFQRNYYEHIIRNETELNEIREYIHLNPSMWEKDKYNSINNL